MGMGQASPPARPAHPGEIMLKESAVASFGQHSLLVPAWIKSALAANDRLKLYLTTVQAAIQHAEQPARAPIDLSRERAAAGVHAAWLDELVLAAERRREGYFAADFPRLCEALASDLQSMARPLLEAQPGTPALKRLQPWLDWLRERKDGLLTAEDIDKLERGSRGKGDSVHLLVMDMHKAINQLAIRFAGETIDGAHAWNLTDEDRALVTAFMRGLNRTAPLKFDHPGLDTAATRDGEKLMLQNDIGTNDAHVLVIQVEGLRISLTYSDLHAARFGFFRGLIAGLGATWSVVEPRVSPGLNAGAAYFVGTATFECDAHTALDAALEGIGSRIVFLIDWNRARKRLRKFVAKPAALAILGEAARREIGHMGWLKSGGERLVFGAMRAAGETVFQLGDRLDGVLGAEVATEFLLDLMGLCTRAQMARQPLALIEDEARVMLARKCKASTGGFDLLAEHAAWCHSLSQAVRDALAHGGAEEDEHGDSLATRAKRWERRADQLVTEARRDAERHPHWAPFARLANLADDVADALEESAFLIDLIADFKGAAYKHGVLKSLQPLAETVFTATQDYVKAVEIARTLGESHDLEDSNAFLDATWRVVMAETRCDEQLRTARRTIMKSSGGAADLMLATDLAGNLEDASDRLLVASHALRALVLGESGTTR